MGGFEAEARPWRPDGVPWDFVAQLLEPDHARFEPLFAGALRRTSCLADAGVKRLVNGPDGYTPDGEAGFFHPDLWTFGQEIRASQIIGRVHEVEGVEHVISLTMKRFNEATPGTDDHLVLRANEIVLVRNDPDHMERGFIDFDVRGGRQ